MKIYRASRSKISSQGARLCSRLDDRTEWRGQWREAKRCARHKRFAGYFGIEMLQLFQATVVHFCNRPAGVAWLHIVQASPLWAYWWARKHSGRKDEAPDEHEDDGNDEKEWKEGAVWIDIHGVLRVCKRCMLLLSVRQFRGRYMEGKAYGVGA